MRSNFNIICQHCDEEIDLYDLAFEQNKIDGNILFYDADSFELICPECKRKNLVSPKAIWRYDIEKLED